MNDMVFSQGVLLTARATRAGSGCEHQQNLRWKYHRSTSDLVMECKEFSTVNAPGFEVILSSAEF